MRTVAMRLGFRGTQEMRSLQGCRYFINIVCAHAPVFVGYALYAYHRGMIWFRGTHEMRSLQICVYVVCSLFRVAVHDLDLATPVFVGYALYAYRCARFRIRGTHEMRSLQIIHTIGFPSLRIQLYIFENINVILFASDNMVIK